MNEILFMILIIGLGVAAYFLGWANCKTKMNSVLKESLENQKTFEDARFNSGWLSCVQFILDRF